MVAPSTGAELAHRVNAANLRHNREHFNPFAHLPAAEQAMVNNFMVSSSVGLDRHWVTTGKAMPLPRLLKLSGQLLEHGAAAVARR
ncbi:hypothetical protein HMPREF3227_01057 [Corynebacterium sp. CMW7794]|uniref:hypothetical protein n=1 Tax=Corynebacterium TaxID=1716 RepID=UPI000798DD68|nr:MULTISPECIES: hypothetical protein [Corynebacterium]KXB56426.1 hypothetical protein HMPREF0307_00117 [Corynebacterium sp. DNF00584]KXI18235.1 hypothetical protein HMPREF3227_01057 [Corynebacterium sp. CMW7794]